MERRTSDPWMLNSNDNLQQLSFPPENHHHPRVASLNWSPNMASSADNRNFNPENYYDFLSTFDQLSISNTPQPVPPPYSGHLNRGGGGSILQNNLLNNGTSLSHINFPGTGNLMTGTRVSPLQRELFNGYMDHNLNGSYYDQDFGYDRYTTYVSDKYFGGGYGREDEYFARSLSRGSINQNSSSFGRNRTGLGNDISFQPRAESLDGFRDPLDSTGNGVYGTKQMTNFSSLEELKGKLVLVAKDQHGGRFLQSKIEEGNVEDVQIIYSEVKDRIRELMVHQYANYIIQKLFDVCNEEQITKLLLSVVQDDHILMDICVDMHGTKVMQKLIENLSSQEQRSILVSVLRRITVVLMKSVNGHHVIQSCFKCFPPQDKKQILNVVADNCLEIATDQSGCCVLQQCIIHAEGELRERLVAEITANALILSEHPYGNYVVQHIVGLHLPRVTAEIVARLSGNFVFLSVNKHGSNVVEHILKECPDHVNTIVIEIINSQNLLMVVQDPYGNYVVQTALAKSKGTVHYKLMTLIQSNYAFLHSHLYGKRVLAKTRTKGSRSFRM